VWTRANTALAALTPAQPAITRSVGGTVYTVAAAQLLLDGYTNLVKTQKDKEELLDVTRTELRTHERLTDQLNKRWYKVAKASSDAGSDLYEALSGITTEPGTPVPDTIEINTVTQGGEGGRQVLVAYVPGGGAHATTNAIARVSRSRNAVGATSRARLHATGIAATPAMTAGARTANSLTLPVSITIAHMASVIGT
jgi:hypothetical protein